MSRRGPENRVELAQIKGPENRAEMSQIKGPENRAETAQKRTQVGPESGPETDPKWPKKQQPSSKPKESPKIKAQKYSSKRDESKLSSNYIKTKQSPDTGPIGPKTRPIIKKNRPKYVVNGSPTNHLKFYYQSGKTKQRRHLQGRELHRTGRKLVKFWPIQKSVKWAMHSCFSSNKARSWTIQLKKRNQMDRKPMARKWNPAKQRNSSSKPKLKQWSPNPTRPCS